jgi:hypothetical protein
MEEGSASLRSRGVCEFTIEVLQSECFRVVADGGGLAFEDGAGGEPSSRITMPASIATFLLDQPERIDFRSPTLLTHLEIDGDVEFALSLGLLLRRPSAATRARFDEAGRLCAGDRITAVERLRGASDRDVAQRLAAGQPLVIEGALTRWGVPITLDRFAQQFGDCMLALDDRFVPYRRIADLVAAMRASRTESTAGYTNGCEIPGPMRSAWPSPFFNRSSAFEYAQLWMGFGSRADKPVTPLHRDNLHGLLAQVFGVKRLMLFSPDQGELLYASKAFNTSQPCAVDPAAPDLGRYPLFERARGFEVRLAPGEVLALPVGWFHCVFAEGPVISVSYSIAADTWSSIAAEIEAA